MTRIEEIAKLLNISNEMAEKVLQEMDIDFSECEQKEFEACARSSYNYITRYEIKDK